MEFDRGHGLDRHDSLNSNEKNTSSATGNVETRIAIPLSGRKEKNSKSKLSRNDQRNQEIKKSNK